MSLTLEQKKAVVSEVHAVATDAQSAVAAEYSGLTVRQMTALRDEARKLDVYVRVVKNNLARRAVEGTEFECLNEALTGPLVLAFSRDDPAAGARVFRDFSKSNEQLKTTAIVLAGTLHPGTDLERIAKMPTLDQARAMLLGLMQAPATQLVRTLAEPGTQFVRLLSAYRDSKQ